MLLSCKQRLIRQAHVATGGHLTLTSACAFPLLHSLQIRRGVLGFELEQLPPDMAEAAGLPQQQQQHGGQASAAAGDDPDERDPARQLHSLRSSGPGGLGDRQRYREAADRLRQRLAGMGGHHGKVRRWVLVCNEQQQACFEEAQQEGLHKFGC